MKQKFSRAQRRAERQRIKEKRQYHYGYGCKENWEQPQCGDIKFMSDKMSGMISKTTTFCSCWGCGNPRKYKLDGGITLQEKQNNDSYQAGFDEYYNVDEFEFDGWWNDNEELWDMDDIIDYECHIINYGTKYGLNND